MTSLRRLSFNAFTVRTIQRNERLTFQVSWCVQKSFYSYTTKKYSMRVVDERILDQLQMLYREEDCFHPLHTWFGTAETHHANLKRLFTVVDYAQKHNLSAAKNIMEYRKQIKDLFRKTKNYAREWDSKQQENHTLTTQDYIEATEEQWDALDKWTATQEKLRRTLLEFIRLLYSAIYEI
ncbi:MAG: hypothetical protein ACOC6G_04595 [Thermoproteota archaeon]